MAWPSARYATAARGSAWGWDKMNGVQDWLTRPLGLVAGDFAALDTRASASNAALVSLLVPDSTSVVLCSTTLTLPTAGLVGAACEVNLQSAQTGITGAGAPKGFEATAKLYVDGVEVTTFRELSAPIRGEPWTFVRVLPERLKAVSAGRHTVELRLVLGFDDTGRASINARGARLWTSAYPF